MNPLLRGTLLNRVGKTTDAALQMGALKPIKTETRVLSDGGVDFLVRLVESLARKDAEKSPEGRTEQKKRGEPKPLSSL